MFIAESECVHVHCVYSLVSRLPPQVYGRPLTYGRKNWDEPYLIV